MGSREERVGDLPDAIASIESILALIGQDAYLFFDYDGTLTPIVDKPEDAVAGESIRWAIRRLAGKYRVGVVSGRGVDDVRALLDLEGIDYAGSHGHEIEYADGGRFEFSGSVEARQDLQAAADVAVRLTHGLDGVVVERKPYAVAIHTRAVGPDLIRVEAASIVREIAARSEKLVVSTGKEVIEIRPAVQWDKGRAIAYLHDRFGTGPPLFVGDDQTDEDGFEAVTLLDGVGIIVSRDEAQLTRASHRLDDPGKVEQFLKFL